MCHGSDCTRGFVGYFKVRPCHETCSLTSLCIRWCNYPSNSGNLGEKREHGAQHSHGEVVLMMDDDDWFATANHTRTFFSADSTWMTRLCGRYSTTHISKMVSPILSGSIDVVASPYAWVFNARQGAWWHAAAEPIINAGPLAFRRKFWSGGVHYPAVPLGEDIYFLWLLFSVGARVLYLKYTGSYVYVRHGCGNTWQMRLPNLRTAHLSAMTSSP